MNSTLTEQARQVLAALRSNVEYTEQYDGADWGMVYLDNAKPRDMSQASFRSYLATLSGAGLYKVEDGYAWGLVRIAGE